MSGSGFFSFLDHLTYVEDDASRYEIDVGDNGFSYLDMVSDKKARTLTFEQKQQRSTSAALDGSTRARGQLNITKREIVNHDAVCLDTDLMAILRDVEERRRKTAFFPIVAGAFGVILFVWLMMPLILKDGWVYLIVSIWIPPILLIFLWNVWKLDLSRKQVRLSYRLSGKGDTAFQKINEALGSLTRSDQLLLYTGRRHFEDTRYSGGAESLPEFSDVRVRQTRPPFIGIDFDVWSMHVAQKDLFFMPDHLLVFQGANAGGISYARLELNSNLEVAQASQKHNSPTDGNVVGHTYRFVNKDGTPDQRFNNNVQIPLIEYGIFSVKGAGLDVTVYSSKQDAATSAPARFHSIQRLAGLPARKIAGERRGEQPTASHSESKSFYHVLLDVLCCVMVADGRASQSEKQMINGVLGQYQCPWTSEEINLRTASFIKRVQKDGFRNVLASTCEAVRPFGGGERKTTLLQSLNSIAKADGKVDERETKVLARLRAALGE